MSLRPKIKPYPVFNATTGQDMSLTSLTSLVTIISPLSLVSYAYSWTGSTPVGTITVQVSNDYSIDSEGNTLNAGTWNNLTFSSGGSTTSTFSVTGNTGNGYVDILPSAAYAIRTVYTKISGTGTISATFNGKVT